MPCVTKEEETLRILHLGQPIASGAFGDVYIAEVAPAARHSERADAITPFIHAFPLFVAAPVLLAGNVLCCFLLGLAWPCLALLGFAWL